MNNTIDLKNITAQFCDRMGRIPASVPDSADIYMAAVSPDLELTVILRQEAATLLPCFDEADRHFSVSAGIPVIGCYDPRQVVCLADKRYLTGAVIFARIDGTGRYASLTAGDLYKVQEYLEQADVSLMAGCESLTCICID